MIQTEETLESRPSESRLGAPRDGEAKRDATSPAETTETPEIVIRPRSGWIAIDWHEIYDFRELLVFFVWRDISSRYRQTVLGGAWAVLQPLIMMAIFVFLAQFAKIAPPMDLPYPVCVFAGLIPWSIFSQGMPAAANSLITSLHMVTKVYFPRLFLPITAAAVFLVDAMLTMLLYGGILLYYQITPQWTVVFLPVLILLTMIATLSFGILLSGLTLFYRDFKHIVPFVVQIMMFVTPTYYSIGNVPERYRLIASLNPMFGIVDAFRSCILGTPMYWSCFLISTTVAVLGFVFAVFYFRRTERLFADFV
ncbi:ABC transporter permease [Paludisphaera borealis]|uniref:Transport permease protein n=1 Tax=Paludisphaera borealis TaxID=1387353 RepID=A0A1U7CZ43_9BACT|nr:ABC transporter permease [Paludisphaera borealis]APW64232.1 Teichoic acid translocation permease protein TagG [Paludisphaera borealis]